MRFGSKEGGGQRTSGCRMPWVIGGAAVRRKIQRALGAGLVMHQAPLQGEPRLSMAGLLFRVFRSFFVGSERAGCGCMYIFGLCAAGVPAVV